MTFRNALLPIACDLDWQSAAAFSTDVVTMDNGAEQRNINWDGTLARAMIRYNARNKRIWNAISDFYQSVALGRGYSFKVRDPRKWIAEPGEGVFVDGQAVLRITRDGYTIDKTITKLGDDAIVVGGTADPMTGISENGADTWSGTFYLCMRFDTDTLEAVGVNKKFGSDDLIAGFPDVPLVEVPNE